jgi:hypothetical protein
MAADEQRIADLEQQLADLTARCDQLEHKAFLFKTLHEMRMDRLESLGVLPSVIQGRPRHLHAVNGGAS